MKIKLASVLMLLLAIATTGGAVGPYRGPNKFSGIIESVVVEIDPE